MQLHWLPGSAFSFGRYFHVNMNYDSTGNPPKSCKNDLEITRHALRMTKTDELSSRSPTVIGHAICGLI